MDVQVAILIILGLTGIQCTPDYSTAKVCRGTKQKLTHSGTAHYRYMFIKNRYENCTYIDGNLEIVFLNNRSVDYDLSFLESIREVTGYILIVSVFASYIPLTNLQIIRGNELFPHKDDLYSLFVADNYEASSKHIGLKELRFKSLAEIMHGKVAFMNNNLLCFENTINWTDINPTTKPPVKFTFSSHYDQRKCKQCDESCYHNTTKRRNCWGSGPDMCQKLSRGAVCSESCDNRCFGHLPNQCCHVQCAGGCTGPKKTDCLACRKFSNEGECVAFCPPSMIYNDKTYAWEKNPNYKYTYGTLCVKECPPHMLKDNDACVKACKEHHRAQDNECVPCNGPCPKTCEGTKGLWLDSKNIENFRDCTVIEGNLALLGVTFTGDEYNNVTGLDIKNLDWLQGVQEITGYLTVQASPPELKDLSFLKNLKVIGGRNIDSDMSLRILETKLENLGLISLKSIKNGNVLIHQNKKLCYVDSMNFTELFTSKKQIYQKKGNGVKGCENKVCHPQCKNGCWGEGPDRCLNCVNYRVENKNLCVASCASMPRLYNAGNKLCKKCHVQCANNCTGPHEYQCDSCLRVQHGPNCMEKCPPAKYPDENRICQPCHPNCDTDCTGPLNELLNGGCNSCKIGQRQSDGRIVCVSKDIEECPDGYHRDYHRVEQMKDKILCSPCHKNCLTCLGSGEFSCKECRMYKYHSKCVNECPKNFYNDDENKTCQECHPECMNGCSGPLPSECYACRNFKIPFNHNQTVFNCSEMCPVGMNYHVKDIISYDMTVCADASHPIIARRLAEAAEQDRKKLTIIIIAVICGVSFLLILSYFCYKRTNTKAMEKVAKLNATMMRYDETEPMTPTGIKPDLAQLRLIKESELRRGGIIGSGAFGTVYKGFWIPDGENIKIPVAIKVLQEGTSPSQNKELLEEARVMTSVDQYYCIRILAVCMTAQMMLITPLMPLGCLLDYIRKNKKAIGSKVLLNWCTQIAKGMAYLEEHAIVHRDLAARNVLLQTPNHVRITDFGLAKLLDYNEEEYIAAGGKMPIKWLALECIQHRIFTHKSDVWSYGVTVWELFTYGQRPYESVRAPHVPDLLEKGERLPQPSMCTIDVYMIMIKCWMLDADSRPSFKELAGEFAKMSRDPGRYLVIEGDKLMRLPNTTYDKQDLFHNLIGGTDVPEKIVEAEDYLMPQSAQAPEEEDAADNNNEDPKQGSLVGYAGELFQTDCVTEKELDTEHRRREKRYGHLESAAAARQQRQMAPSRGREDSVSSRYSTDPIKYSKERDDLSDLDPNNLSINGTNKLNPIPSAFQSSRHLPVDEDDYLQPKSTNPAAYMDLIGEKGSYNDRLLQLRNDKLYPHDDEIMKDIMGPSTLVPVENPEYFEQNEPKGASNGNVDIFPWKDGNGVSYYNDISNLDKSRRELQPLMHEDPNSETTV